MSVGGRREPSALSFLVGDAASEDARSKGRR